jgi:type IV pilus assembly protein PilA
MLIREPIPRARRRRAGIVRRRAARQRGYTIIELMLVITILSILTVIAVTAYINYTTRTRMAEVMLAASQCKTAVYEAYYYGTPPDDGSWGCEASTSSLKYVESIDLDENGKVTVKVRGFNDSSIDGKAFTLTPIVNGAPATFATGRGKNLLWRCGHAVDGTTVPSRFLPFSCRG